MRRYGCSYVDYEEASDPYFTCDYCGGVLSTVDSDYRENTYRLLCPFCSKNLDKKWDLECEMENIIHDLNQAIVDRNFVSDIRSIIETIKVALKNAEPEGN